MKFTQKWRNWNFTICEIPHCSILEVSIGLNDPDDLDRSGRSDDPYGSDWLNDPDRLSRPEDTNGPNGPNYQNKLGRPDNQDRSGIPGDSNRLGAWWARRSRQPIRTMPSKFWNSSQFGWVDLEQNLENFGLVYTGRNLTECGLSWLRPKFGQIGLSLHQPKFDRIWSRQLDRNLAKFKYLKVTIIFVKFNFINYILNKYY